MEPTPPPEVVAMTKFTYQERGAGDDALDKMWVTNVRRDGNVTLCYGWMLRYPHANNPTTNGANLISIGGNPGGFGAPIVEAVAHIECSEHALVPFTPPSSPSP